VKAILSPAECELKKARQRAQSKKWRDANPEKNREFSRRWALSNPDKRRENDRLWKNANADKVRSYQKTYRDKHKAELAASKAAYYQNNREDRLAWYRQYYLNNREKEISRRKIYQLRIRSVNQIRNSPDDVMRIVTQAVSDRLPRHLRDDVISSVLLAVLEGKLLLDQVESRIQDYIRTENRMFNTFRSVSLDDVLPGTDLRRIDMITADDLPWANS
jgi:hypothetical protein